MDEAPAQPSASTAMEPFSEGKRRKRPDAAETSTDDASVTNPAAGECVNCGQPLPGSTAATWFTPVQGSFVYAIGRLSPQFNLQTSRTSLPNSRQTSRLRRPASTIASKPSWSGRQSVPRPSHLLGLHDPRLRQLRGRPPGQ